MVAPSIEELIDARAARTPHARAVDGDTAGYTYAELAGRSRQIAAMLRGRELPPGSLVALDLGAGPDLVAAMVGVLRAGLAFLPLQTEAPPARRQALLRRAGAGFILTPETLADIGAGPSPDAPVKPSPVKPPPAQLAYAIFTSGSTGEPKAVMIERRSFAAMLAAHHRLGLRPDDRYLVFAPPHFDGFLVDTFVSLAAGACAVIRPRQEIMPGEDLAQTLAEQKITFATIPPAALALLPCRDYPCLRGILTAGERIPGRLAASWSARLEVFCNSYGPTETTVAATLGRYAPGEPESHIGSPLPGVRVHILDEQQRPVPAGERGEICVSGWGVARGYLNEPALTAARFLPDPFEAEPGARMYRTGDIGSWRTDGNIAFHGRRDDELKIRGVRIHPSEIESALLNSGLVANAAVVAAGSGAEARLVGFVVPAAGTRRDDLPEALRRVLARQLPAEYSPQEFRCMDSLPAGATNKVDRGRLRELAEPRDQVGPPPAGGGADLRERVATVWTQVLGTPVAAESTKSFFELGGHSLMAVKMLDRLGAEVGASMKYVDFFRDSTISGITAWLAERRAS